ncbi:trypsin-like serine peptidase [Mycolicibacterium grossiae]|uniref:Trypsin n=1 Tax=Mycolicibacterium grossiae TaxID=1552759 RepID=A0A1E8QB86_9MYCO|nr:trypsin-like serine protease [Mycolicibacterium grossiae]OFJ55350.1 trypsin [Mycolicibacterium grossiae]QEM46248.1 trypsin-like serine protease [Mycolicibacterium grossiae]
MRIRLVVLALTALAASCAHPVAAPLVEGAAAVASAEPVSPDSRVGAVFLGGQTVHTCSGAVLDSPAGDLVITAAHCVAGGLDAYFVPGYDQEDDDQGFWHVDAVYLDPRWLKDQDQQADVVVARVSREGGPTVEAASGGGFTPGPAPGAGTAVTITGYELGFGGGPVGCQATTTTPERGFPALPCAGMSDGTSGSPWVVGSTLVGLTGGLDGGGCEDSVSYSPPFDGALDALVRRAEQGGPGDDAPTSLFDDGC